MYQVKKSKPRKAHKTRAFPPEPVSKSLPGSEPSAEGQEFLGKQFRVLDRYALQDDLVDTLRQTKRHKHLVKRAGMCHRSFEHWACDKVHEWAKAFKSCNCRLCPHCQRKRSLKLSHKWAGHLTEQRDLRYVVLSERNSSDLGEGLASLYRAWTRLRATALWKRATVGCIAVLEVTYNRNEKTWHPHLNVVFEGDYIPFEALRQEWSEATRHTGQTAFIRKCDAGTVRELLKYVTKLSDFVEQPEAVDSFLHATKRRRFIRTYGTLYNLPVEENDNEQACPDCGSTCTVKLGLAHANQIAIDFKGVLRIDSKKLRPSQQPSSEDVFIVWPNRPPVRDTVKDTCRELVEARVVSEQAMRWKSTHQGPVVQI